MVHPAHLLTGMKIRVKMVGENITIPAHFSGHWNVMESEIMVALTSESTKLQLCTNRQMTWKPTLKRRRELQAGKKMEKAKRAERSRLALNQFSSLKE